MTGASEYERALVELYALSSRGIEPGLDRMRLALDAVGHPERAFDVIHVAGTNGKGSVSRMVAGGLLGPVGLFTSPHLHRLIERFQVFGGAPIDEATLAREWATLRDLLASVGAPPLTFFETITVLSFRLFASAGVEVVVLETGLGGRLDSTNVIERPICCAITRVAMDHERFLGATLASVAREKAGILKAGVPAVIAPQAGEAMRVLEEVAAEVGAELVTPPSTHPRPSLRGAHQLTNAAVATGVLQVVSRAGRHVDVARGIESAVWPGRLEEVAGAPSFLFDGAHNPDGAAALARHLSDAPRHPRVLVFGAMADKDWRAMIDSLRPLVDAIVCTAPSLARAESPEVLAAYAGGVALPLEPALRTARALATERGEVVVAGSLYLVGEARARVLGVESDPTIAM